MPKWLKRWEIWLGFAVLLGGAYAAVANTIPDFPRWTWFSEHTALVQTHEDDIDAMELTHETDTLVLAGRIKENTIRALEEKVGYLRRERRALRAAQRSLKFKGDHDPKLQEEADENEDELRDAENKLKAKRGH